MFKFLMAIFDNCGAEKGAYNTVEAINSRNDVM